MTKSIHGFRFRTFHEGKCPDCKHSWKNHKRHGCNTCYCNCTNQNKTVAEIVKQFHHRFHILPCPVCDKLSGYSHGSDRIKCRNCQHVVSHTHLLIWHGYLSIHMIHSAYRKTMVRRQMIAIIEKRLEINKRPLVIRINNIQRFNNRGVDR